MSDEKKFGDIEFHLKDTPIASVKFDRIAVSGRDELLLVSFVADTQRVKQIRAMLAKGVKSTATVSGIRVMQAGSYSHTPGKLWPSADGYSIYTHKLGYGQAHALVVTKKSGFMKVVTPETLWQELKDVRFTTPLLPEWVTHIEAMLRLNDSLEDAHAFNCKCGILSCTTKSLDLIVSEGLQQKMIEIPQPTAAA